MTISTIVAGPLEATLDGVRLRWIRYGGVEILRAIEITVRDPAWGTVIPEVRDLDIRDGHEVVQVSYRAAYRDGPIAFDVAANLELSSGGLRVAMTGVALTPFRANRIGLIVLHPIDVAGREVQYQTEAGSIGTKFPRNIAPWTVATGLSSMSWQPVSGVRAILDLAGDVWEIEDQRNWTDASFKTYPTPLDRPRPVAVAVGGRFDRSVTLRILGEPRKRRRTPHNVTIMDRASDRLPAIGAGLPDRDEYDHLPFDAIRPLGLHHLRITLDLSMPDSRDRAERAIDAADAMATATEVDVTADPERDATALRELAFALARRPRPPIAVNVFSSRSTTGWDSDGDIVRTWQDAAKQAHFRCPIGVGTRANFTELNRTHPPIDGDIVTYSVNPQVHAFDAASIIETLDVLPIVARQASRIGRSRPQSVVVSFRPRFNTSGAAPDDVHDEEAARFDARLGTSFAAAWLVGALGGLSIARIRRLTVFDTHGPTGLVPTPFEASDRPCAIARIVGALAPLVEPRVLTSSPTSSIAVLGVRHRDGDRVLVANLLDADQVVRMRLSRPGRWEHRRLTDLKETIEHGPVVDVALRPFSVHQLDHRHALSRSRHARSVRA